MTTPDKGAGGGAPAEVEREFAAALDDYMTEWEESLRKKLKEDGDGTQGEEEE